jgi:aspartate aminotransferase-like enzyme
VSGAEAREPIDFFLPGPVYVREAVRREMLKPVVAHRSPEFRAVWDRLSRGLPPIFRTTRPCFTATGSSTLLMEASLVSLTRDAVLHLINGSFSERWSAVGRSLGRASDEISVPWGEAVTPELLRAALRRRRYEAVTVVHNETSTGVLTPIAELARVVREESDALLLVDTVSSLAAAPVETDAWDLDFVFAGVQKGIAAPPGLTVFTFSERAERRAEAIPHRGFYGDLLRYRDKQREGGPITTPAMAECRALALQLERVAAEGLEVRWRRHQALAARCASWAAARPRLRLGRGVRSPSVSCLRAPAGRGGARTGAARRGSRLHRRWRLRPVEAGDVSYRTHGRSGRGRSRTPARRAHSRDGRELLDGSHTDRRPARSVGSRDSPRRRRRGRQACSPPTGRGSPSCCRSSTRWSCAAHQGDAELLSRRPGCASSAGPASASTTSTSPRRPSAACWSSTRRPPTCLGHRAHLRAAAGAGAQPAGRRRLDEARRVGPQELRRRRAAGQDASASSASAASASRSRRARAPSRCGWWRSTRSSTPAQASRLEVEMLPLDDLLAAADVVTLHTPLTRETRNLLDAARIARLKPARWWSTAAAAASSTRRRCSAIEAGRIAGAAARRLRGGADAVARARPPPEGRGDAAHRRPDAGGAGAHRPRDGAHGARGARRRDAVGGRQSAVLARRPPRRAVPGLAERLGRLAGSLLGAPLTGLEVDLGASTSDLLAPVAVARSKGRWCRRSARRSTTSTPSGSRPAAASAWCAARAARRRTIRIWCGCERSATDRSELAELAGARRSATGEPRVVEYQGYRLEFEPRGRLLLLVTSPRRASAPSAPRSARCSAVMRGSGSTSPTSTLARKVTTGEALSVLRIDEPPTAEVPGRADSLALDAAVQSVHGDGRFAGPTARCR